MTNIIDKIAGIIEPGAFSSDWLDIHGNPVKLADVAKSRNNYFKSEAQLKAARILKEFAGYSQGDILQALIDYETEGWRKRGLPVDDPELWRVIERKYRISETAE